MTDSKVIYQIQGNPPSKFWHDGKVLSDKRNKVCDTIEKAISHL